MQEHFRRFSQAISHMAGTAWSFVLAVSLILVWIATGPLFNFSNTWQLVINTTTTVVTFLMVFLIQNTQNRDSKAIHLKLDELLHSVQKARDGFINIEDMTDEELDKLQAEFKQIQERYNKAIQHHHGKRTVQLAEAKSELKTEPKMTHINLDD